MLIDVVDGLLLAVIGATWLVPELAGWLSGPASLAAIADAWSRLLVALVVVAFVRRLRSEAWARSLAVAAIVAGALGAASRLLFVDPFLDVRCWRRCDPNPLAVTHGQVGPVLDRVSALAVAGCAVTCSCLAVLGRWPRPDRPVHAMSLAAATLVIGSVVPGVLRSMSTESAISTPFLTAWVLAQLGALGIGIAAIRDRWLQWHLRVRLQRLATAFESLPEALTEALRVALRDQGLEVRYWAASHSAYVDAEGGAVDPPRSDEQSRLTLVARRGAPIAAIVHRHGIDVPRLEHALGPALRLKLENDQLRAAALAELQSLNESRTRVVERAALERHRLERNLHDGAQQRVVALALIVRMIAQSIARGRSADDCAAALVERAEALTRATVQELRRVARGIYPAVIADAGLAGAVMELAESSSDLAVRVVGGPSDRYAGIVESTAYLVVATVVADARDRGAASLDLCGRVAGDMLIYELVDDAAAGPGKSVLELTDQVGALSGTLAVIALPAANRVRLELPCG
jgi:signal transduction histidine kinase